MFDVELPGGESYRESRNFEPGSKAVLVDLPWGTLGLTICYDLRFPALYRALAKAGAQLIAVPSAFTVPTGQAHWHVLLRARAIESQCFILAAAQVGEHESGRTTYGHSLILSPWKSLQKPMARAVRHSRGHRSEGSRERAGACRRFNMIGRSRWSTARLMHMRVEGYDTLQLTMP